MEPDCTAASSDVDQRHQQDDGTLVVEDTVADGNVEGSFDFDGTEDGMHYGSLDLNGNFTPMASAKASSTARWTRMERLAGLRWYSL